MGVCHPAQTLYGSKISGEPLPLAPTGFVLILATVGVRPNPVQFLLQVADFPSVLMKPPQHTEFDRTFQQF